MTREIARPSPWGVRARYVAACAVMALLAACGGGGDDTVAVREQVKEEVAPVAVLAPEPLSGAIFTTNATCDGTNINIYELKADVYLDGGPRKPGAAGLPDGWYFVKVTTPNDVLLGYTTTASVQVAGNEVQGCPQLWNILTKADNTGTGYLDTTNAGGEYKVWISQDPAFPNDKSKTDNFKVKKFETICPDGTEPDESGNCIVIDPKGELVVKKFYDANANGLYDTGEVYLVDWKVNIRIEGTTDAYDAFTTYSELVGPNTYTVSEYAPLEANWAATTPTSVLAQVFNDQTTTVAFGNVCTGAGGGLTLGFWSNKNGQALVGDDDLLMLKALNLRNANGLDFDPSSAGALSKWLLAATATNMANMLSAQMAATALNVHNLKVDGNALIYAPGTGLGNALGYATVSDVMAAADASLLANNITVAASPTRTYQEALKNALDAANNNRNFVQAQACPFTFVVN